MLSRNTVVTLLCSRFAPCLAFQVANSLQKLPGPVQFLCARAQNSAVQEIHFADNHNILSHECLEHKYIQSKLCTAAPSVGCWQQAMLDMAAANAVGQADNSEGHDEHIAVLHQLYEWVGAVSCGIQGKNAITGLIQT